MSTVETCKTLNAMKRMQVESTADGLEGRHPTERSDAIDVVAGEVRMGAERSHGTGGLKTSTKGGSSDGGR